MDAFFSAACSAYPDLAPAYRVLDDLHANKQWHQLTEALLAFALSAGCSRDDNLVQLYERFVSTCESRLDQLSLVRVVCAAASQLARSRPAPLSEVDAALAFLAPFASKRERLGVCAALVLDMESVVLGVRRAAALAAGGDGAGAGAALDAAKVAVRSGEGVLAGVREGSEPCVAAAVHRAAAEYHKLRGPAAAFYASALAYLGCIDLESLPAGERHALAVDVALAALVGEGVFNFGEVASQPVLRCLAGTPEAWLAELLRAFQAGSIDAFNALANTHASAMAAQPALAAAASALKEKITLLAVMELAAKRPVGARFLTFGDIAAETRLPVAEVEWLTMRAMSLGLIKGTIDQVDQVVNITYVKPRVLNLAQVRALKDQVDAWRDKAEAAMRFVEERGAELWQG